MTLSDIARRRLTLLLPMLASDKDGEVVASVRKIAKVLAADGKDFHDLTKLLAGPTVVYETKFRDRPEREPPRQQAPENEWLDKATYCAGLAHTLSEREAEFVRDMVGKIKRWGDPTEKQAKWLDAIYQRMRRRYGETA